MYVNMVISVHIESPVGGAVVLSGKTMKLHFTFKLLCQLQMLDFIFYILLTSLKTSEQISKQADQAHWESTWFLSYLKKCQKL